MNIQIFNHANALAEVKSHPGKYNVVFITNPDDPFYRPELHDLITGAKQSLICKFHDVDIQRYDPKLTNWDVGPTKEHIQNILQFAKDKDDLIVCCHAGISRSSATAFVILCVTKNPEEAIGILDMHKHDPNNLIVKYGSELLDKPEMVDVIKKFKTQMMEEVYGC